MTQKPLDEKEQAIADSYRRFIAQVKVAFNAHCEEIKKNALEEFNAIPEEDQEGRRKVLADQKAELDKTLSELKEVLGKKGAKTREGLEEIANLRDQQGFNLEEQLEEIGKGDEKKHLS